MVKIKNALAMIESALPGLDRTTPLHQEVLKTLQRLGKFMAQGSPTAGVQQTQFGDLLRQLAQNTLLSRIKQMQGAGGPGQGGPPGAMAQAPMPSTPLPGA
jgi:hypothetical protein